MTIATEFADFIVGLRYEDLTDEAINKARACLLDQIGVQVAGARAPWNRPVTEYAMSLGGIAESTVVLQSRRAPRSVAAMANATFGQGIELDDYLGRKARPRRARVGSISGHAGAVTIPAALSVAEAKGTPANMVLGREIIVAIVLGYEVMGRLSYALRDGLRARGFHLDSVLGGFASAAASARLLRLDRSQVAHALAITGSHASGTMEYDQTGGEVKRLHAGLAARGGLESALLAERGLTGPPSIFEGKRGVLRAFGDVSGAFEDVTDRLGEDLLIEDVGFKIHPVRAGIAGALDTVAQVLEEPDFNHADIEAVTIEVAEQQVVSCAGRRPTDTIGAQMSIPFAVALYLVKGSDDLDEFADPRNRQDEDIRRVEERTELVGNPDFRGAERHTTKLSVRLRGGRTLRAEQVYARGSTNNPLSGPEAESKFRRLVKGRLAADRIETVIGEVARVDQLPTVDALMNALSGR